VSCAACRSAKGYATACPYCREPGDLQRKATAAMERDVSASERIAVALERCAVALEKIASAVDDDSERPSFHVASDGVVQTEVNGVVTTSAETAYEREHCR
jgi:hypothetical protein